MPFGRGRPDLERVEDLVAQGCGSLESESVSLHPVGCKKAAETALSTSIEIDVKTESL